MTKIIYYSIIKTSLGRKLILLKQSRAQVGLSQYYGFEIKKSLSTVCCPRVKSRAIVNPTKFSSLYDLLSSEYS